MNPDKLARIKEIMDVANKDYATNAEVAMILKQITNYLTKTKGEYDDLMEDMQERVDDQMDKVKEICYFITSFRNCWVWRICSLRCV